MESSMAELASCLSTKVARDGEITILGTPAVSRHVGPGPQAAPGIGDGLRPARGFERSRRGLGESLGPALTPPEACRRTCALSRHVPPPDRNAHHPQPDGRPQGRRAPSLCRAASWHAPGSWQPSQHRVRVLLSDL